MYQVPHSPYLADQLSNAYMTATWQLYERLTKGYLLNLDVKTTNGLSKMCAPYAFTRLKMNKAKV